MDATLKARTPRSQARRSHGLSTTTSPCAWILALGFGFFFLSIYLFLLLLFGKDMHEHIKHFWVLIEDPTRCRESVPLHSLTNVEHPNNWMNIC